MDHQFNEAQRQENEEIELSLGLSLGGRFGTDPGKRLARSTSMLNLQSKWGSQPVVPPKEEPAAALLARTTSLPLSGEDLRKRKLQQSARRMEAKRRMSEKMMKNERGSSGEVEVVSRPRVVLPRNWVATGPAADAVAAKWGLPPRPRQGSSGICQLEKLSVHGLARARSLPFAAQSVAEQCPSNPGTSVAVKTAVASPPRPPRVVNGLVQQTAAMRDIPQQTAAMRGTAPQTAVRGTEVMPAVFTKNTGPNGRRIQGFLYRYKSGEGQMKIVCACHGSFFSPAEFVKHAGGGDVDNPLRHIVISS